MRLRLLAAGLAAAVIGCSETRSFDLTVHNTLPTPVSVVLTKTHGPDESQWASPEQVAMPPQPASMNTPPGIVIPPDGVIHPVVTGVFDPAEGRAFLRVYLDTPTLSQMIAIPKGSLSRLDVPLSAGVTRFDIVIGPDGRLKTGSLTPKMSTTRPSR